MTLRLVILLVFTIVFYSSNEVDAIYGCTPDLQLDPPGDITMDIGLRQEIYVSALAQPTASISVVCTSSSVTNVSVDTSIKRYDVSTYQQWKRIYVSGLSIGASIVTCTTNNAGGYKLATGSKNVYINQIGALMYINSTVTTQAMNIVGTGVESSTFAIKLGSAPTADVTVTCSVDSSVPTTTSSLIIIGSGSAPGASYSFIIPKSYLETTQSKLILVNSTNGTVDGCVPINCICNTSGGYTPGVKNSINAVFMRAYPTINGQYNDGGVIRLYGSPAVSVSISLTNLPLFLTATDKVEVRCTTDNITTVAFQTPSGSITPNLSTTPVPFVDNVFHISDIAKNVLTAKSMILVPIATATNTGETTLTCTIGSQTNFGFANSISTKAKVFWDNLESNDVRIVTPIQSFVGIGTYNVSVGLHNPPLGAAAVSVNCGVLSDSLNFQATGTVSVPTTTLLLSNINTQVIAITGSQPNVNNSTVKIFCYISNAGVGTGYSRGVSPFSSPNTIAQLTLLRAGLVSTVGPGGTSTGVATGSDTDNLIISSTSNAGGSVTLNVMLSNMPTGNVTITCSFTTGGSNFGGISPTSNIFTPTNFATVQGYVLSYNAGLASATKSAYAVLQCQPSTSANGYDISYSNTITVCIKSSTGGQNIPITGTFTSINEESISTISVSLDATPGTGNAINFTCKISNSISAEFLDPTNVSLGAQVSGVITDAYFSTPTPSKNIFRVRGKSATKNVSITCAVTSIFNQYTPCVTSSFTFDVNQKAMISDGKVTLSCSAGKCNGGKIALNIPSTAPANCSQPYDQGQFCIGLNTAPLPLTLGTAAQQNAVVTVTCTQQFKTGSSLTTWANREWELPDWTRQDLASPFTNSWSKVYTFSVADYKNKTARVSQLVASSVPLSIYCVSSVSGGFDSTSATLSSTTVPTITTISSLLFIYGASISEFSSDPTVTTPQQLLSNSNDLRAEIASNLAISISNVSMPLFAVAPSPGNGVNATLTLTSTVDSTAMQLSASLTALVQKGMTVTINQKSYLTNTPPVLPPTGNTTGSNANVSSPSGVQHLNINIIAAIISCIIIVNRLM